MWTTEVSLVLNERPARVPRGRDGSEGFTRHVEALNGFSSLSASFWSSRIFTPGLLPFLPPYPSDFL